MTNASQFVEAIEQITGGQAPIELGRTLAFYTSRLPEGSRDDFRQASILEMIIDVQRGHFVVGELRYYKRVFERILARFRYAAMKRKREIDLTKLQNTIRDTSIESPTEAVEQGETRQAIADALQAQDPDISLMLYMRLVESCTIREIAQSMDIEPHAVRYRLQTAAESLKKALIRKLH